MDFVAIVPIADILSANNALGEQEPGSGFTNFSVPAYTGPEATHGALHAWGDSVFLSALEETPEVTVQVGPLQVGEDDEGNPIYTEDPVIRTKTLIEAQGAIWGAQAPALPATDTAAVGYYQFDGSLWYVIQSFSRTTYSAHPSTYPALITRVRHPGSVRNGCSHSTNSAPMPWSIHSLASPTRRCTTASGGMSVRPTLPGPTPMRLECGAGRRLARTREILEQSQGPQPGWIPA